MTFSLGLEHHDNFDSNGQNEKRYTMTICFFSMALYISKAVC